MTEIITFTPKAELDAAENVRGFVDVCKNHLTAFGKDLDWDSNAWDVSAQIDRLGHEKTVRFVFSNHDTSGQRNSYVPMDEPFLSFAKGIMRYDFSHNKAENHDNKLAALRALEKALRSRARDGVPRVEKTTPHDLNLAATYLEAKSPRSAYHKAGKLEQVGKFLVDNKLVKAGFRWRNPVKKIEDLQSKIGEEADKHRKEKLPSRNSLRALPQIYHNSDDPRDVIITSLVALTLCSPDRFNEVFALPIGCEREDIGPDGKETYELCWYTSKRGKPTTKQIPHTMRPLCKEAIRRLKEHTQTGRDIARWYENNPDKLYLPRHLEHLRDKELIRSAELAEIIGLANSSGACKWAKRFKLAAYKIRPLNNIGAPTNAYQFSDIEKTIVGMLPKKFPVLDKKTGLKYSSAILIVPKNFFHPRRATYNCMFQAVTIRTYDDQLGSNCDEKFSIFIRNNYFEDDGSKIVTNSHDFRHYLNYLAQRKNLDQLTIALWSSRQRLADNEAYDARSTEERRQVLACSGPDTDESLACAGLTVNDPVVVERLGSVRDILELEYLAVHETRFGYCTHEYADTPCFRFRDCLACTDHLCVTGNKMKTDAIREELRIAEAALERDLEYKKLGISGTDVWSAFNEERIDLLKALLSEMEALPRNPPGTVIRIREGSHTALDVAIEGRVALGDKDGLLIGPVIKPAKLIGSAPKRAIATTGPAK